MGDCVPAVMPLETYERRLAAVRAEMTLLRHSLWAIYGDPAHIGNLVWLTGFDPRFEEALLLIPLQGTPLMLTGNECERYLPISPLLKAGFLRQEVYAPFSLPSQPREHSRTLDAIFQQEGIDSHSRVGVAGWKSYGDGASIDAPSYLVDALRFAAGYENVVDVSDRFIHPRDGLRSVATADEIAFFEWTSSLASEGMKRVIRSMRHGALDYDLLAQANYPGVPLSCAMTLKCGGNRLSLAGACGQRLERGGRFSCGIGYWGANCCRAGWAVAAEDELPPEARGYVDEFAMPYFEAMAAWFEALKPGTQGSDLHDAIHKRLPFDQFHVFLNAGHLIGYEEWISSPVSAGSDVPLRAGMVMQSDVIPSSPEFYSARMEDGYALVDDALLDELATRHPGTLRRCLARRRWMTETLRLPVADSVLPLSNLAGAMFPYFLAPNRLFSAA